MSPCRELPATRLPDGFSGFYKGSAGFYMGPIIGSIRFYMGSIRFYDGTWMLGGLRV